MKKFAAIFLILVVGALILYVSMSGDSTSTATQVASQNTTSTTSGQTGGKAPHVDGAGNPIAPNANVPHPDKPKDDEDETVADEDDRPATEVYKSAEDALKAVKDGAADYDDIILEQFTDLGENCSWCESFYTSIKEMMGAADTTNDQKSYYAEILAVSGRVENVRSLVDSIKNAKSSEEADLYAEALELTVGKDDVVNFLGTNLDAQNETLRESVVAAITNQGSVQAANLLYKHTVERGDTDGYYSLGIGLGEMIPEPETLPFLQELVLKRDPYSHLAVKSLLNYGLDGVKMVFDSLTNSKDAVSDKQMLKDAVDHVNYDEETEAFLKKEVETSKNPLRTEFAKEILADFNLQEKEDAKEP